MSKQLRYIHGSLLKQVTEAIGVTPSRSNMDVVKALLKRALNIDSLGALDERGLSHFITQSAILLATEFAIVIDLPGEDGVD